MPKAVADGTKVRVSVGDSTVLLTQEEVKRFYDELVDARNDAEDAEMYEKMRLDHEREEAGRRAAEDLESQS